MSDKTARDIACEAIAECTDIAQGVRVQLDAGYSPAHAAETMKVAIVIALREHLAKRFNE